MNCHQLNEYRSLLPPTSAAASEPKYAYNSNYTANTTAPMLSIETSSKSSANHNMLVAEKKSAPPIKPIISISNSVNSVTSNSNSMLNTITITNNNSKSCTNNNQLRASVKSEYSVKSEKPLVCRTPPPPLPPNQMHMNKSDLYSAQIVSITDKNMCENSNALGINSTTTHMQQSQINNYLGIDSTIPTTMSQQRSAFDSTMVANSHHMNIEEQYIREQQLRYTQQMNELNSIARPTVSYPGEIVSSRVSYELASRPYDPGSIPTSTAFERYDSGCLPQRSNMYPTYLQPTMEDISNQQKYIHEQQQLAAQAMLKAEHDENCGPIYPRPMYHYDPATGPLPAGFSAINLSVKVGGTPATFKGSATSPTGPVIDLSTSSVTSSSPNSYNSPHYRKLSGSPRPSSPHLGSPHVPSPQGQTLDLSVSRMAHR